MSSQFFNQLFRELETAFGRGDHPNAFQTMTKKDGKSRQTEEQDLRKVMLRIVQLRRAQINGMDDPAGIQKSQKSENPEFEKKVETAWAAYQRYLNGEKPDDAISEEEKLKIDQFLVRFVEEIVQKGAELPEELTEKISVLTIANKTLLKRNGELHREIETLVDEKEEMEEKIREMKRRLREMEKRLKGAEPSKI
ncbi:hypothetical protein CRE_01332 [Caenorhabditis remanei]|uniref:Uncharacterized protein n=1 Tax=Caenorhabditis remanei TaxID=31234 RepID=E3N9R2_CAERE|nr:hypothetical protein CRE_01332 [Caenorhabditis remanei]